MSMPSWLFRAHKMSHLPRLTQLPLGAEITLLLVIKISLLTVLAKTFFSEPQAKHMRMPTNLVEQHLLTPRPALTPSPNGTVTIAEGSVAAMSTESPVSSRNSLTTTEDTHASH